MALTSIQPIDCARLPPSKILLMYRNGMAFTMRFVVFTAHAAAEIVFGTHIVGFLYPTATIYSVSTERLWRARLAVSMSSLTVAINSSTVSGVKDASSSSGHTQAGTLGMRIVIPSSLYSNVVVRHSFGFWCSPHVGAVLVIISLLPFKFAPLHRRIAPLGFIGDIGCYKFDVNRIEIFTYDVQINTLVFFEACAPTDERPFLVRIFFDNSAI